MSTSVVSGNLLGRQFGWGGKRPLGALFDVDFARWSGMVLMPSARDVILGQDPPGHFFLFNDTRAAVRIRTSGIQNVGVPDAHVGNSTGKPLEDYFDRAPWRSNYAARNQLLFARDAPATRRGIAGVVKPNPAWMGRRLAAREWEGALAVGRGMVDGLRNRRGFVMAPRYPD